MDKIDQKILTILQENAKTTNLEISKRLEMAPSAILERIRKLEKNGVIKAYRTQLNPEKTGLDLLVYVIVQSNVPNWSSACSDKLAAIPNVEEIHEVLGEDSYIVKIRVQNMDELSMILKEQIAVLPEVRFTKTTVVMKTIKEGTVFPVKVTKFKKSES